MGIADDTLNWPLWHSPHRYEPGIERPFVGNAAENSEAALSVRASLRPSSSWRSSMQSDRGIEHLTSNYCQMVYRFLYSHVGNREDAEDLTAEVFLRLDRRVAETSIAQRLSTVARAVLADYWRRYYRHTAVADSGDVPMAELAVKPAADSSAVDEMLVEQVLDSLPDHDRRVLELRLLRGYSIEATARELGMTSESVKAVQHRALARATQVAEGAQ